jgi:hypothetical protein
MDKNVAATHRGKGDAFMIVGATLYGFSEYGCIIKFKSAYTVCPSQRYRRIPC